MRDTTFPCNSARKIENEGEDESEGEKKSNGEGERENDAFPSK